MEELIKVVLGNAKGRGKDYKSYLSDVAIHGCISGSCSDLITYAQTHAFFDKHYDAIEEIRQEWEENTGVSIKIEGDLKNDLAWFAYEYIAQQLLDELEENE